MIRRAHGSDYLLIAQHDHALLSGDLAESFGNESFAAPVPPDAAITGISLHDCGWPLHDDEPTLSADHRPLDVFETPREIAFRVWTASIERATRKDAYAGLLVSLHVLSLSVLATDSARARAGAGFSFDSPQERFAIIKFQQRELERQENLRAQLGLHSEKITHKAITDKSRQELEDQLQFNFALLQVMDQLSLAACCTEPPFAASRDLPMHPAGEKVKLSFLRQGNDVMVDPWPFSIAKIELLIPACRVPAKSYKDEAEFRAGYRDAAAEVITAVIRPT